MQQYNAFTHRIQRLERTHKGITQRLIHTKSEAEMIRLLGKVDRINSLKAKYDRQLRGMR